MSVEEAPKTVGTPGERETRGGLLLVEDNEADILFFRRALSKVREGVPLDVVTNGVAAVQALSAEGQQKLPAIVLLDLKLPRMSGLEVLEWMRTQPPLSSVRTVVLTSSSEESDIRRAHALGAAAYVVKPVDFIGLRGVIEAVLAFWEDPSSSAQAHLGRFAASLPAPR
jgi:CheY-like chemotaxis protein